MSKDVSVSLAISHAQAWRTFLIGEHLTHGRYYMATYEGNSDHVL